MWVAANAANLLPTRYIIYVFLIVKSRFYIFAIIFAWNILFHCFILFPFIYFLFGWSVGRLIVYVSVLRCRVNSHH